MARDGDGMRLTSFGTNGMSPNNYKMMAIPETVIDPVA
uniref:Uncharacterized protein n=1 Tax=Arundo donax TaxID=35708 RepID=A0A0A9A1V3_ARUDO